ncbi:MAG: DUF1254 domain-containing protein [Rhizobiaceae bacterium]|nr:DUF1254 domain-containing protein [Rhizobiaceae bacterium]MBL4731165.1 DUF1254 domain-containing protein [Rhizobiaceae bacterium]
MTKRIIYNLVCGLVLAGIIHIIIILLIPTFGTKDASDQLAQNNSLWEFVTLSSVKASNIAEIDPFFEIGACRYDLENESLLVTGPDTDAFWSASVFTEDGKILYSLTKRTAIEGKLSVLVVNPIQMSNLREIQPKEIETSILVETQSNKGFLVLRVLSPDDSWKPGIAAFLDGVQCNMFVAS